MEFIRGSENLKSQKKATALVIGNFDGVHLGHQLVLEQLKTVAREANLLSTVLIFEPQPIEFFSLEKAPSRLTRLREKLQQFKQHDIQRVVCLRFNDKFARLSAAEFVQKILIEALTVKKLIIGDDFRFAKNRTGDYQYLVNAGQQYGFDVTRTRSFNLDNERISSTLIREALAEGDMLRAAKMLGRPYRISGRVVHGDKRGRKIGFATANVELHRYLSPVAGIFSARVYGVKNEPLDAAVYVGPRSVYKGEKLILEVHILDFDEDIYGHHIQVELLEKLRGENSLATEDELILQIKKDITNTRNSLSKQITETIN